MSFYGFDVMKAPDKIRRELEATPEPFLNEELDTLKLANEQYETTMKVVLSDMQKLAQEGVPTDIMTRERENVGAAQAAATTNAASYQDALTMGSFGNKSATKAYSELLKMDAQARLQNEQRNLAMQERYAAETANMKAGIAGAENKAEITNELNPYLMKLQQLQNAQNMKAGAFNSVLQTGVNLAGAGVSADPNMFGSKPATNNNVNPVPVSNAPNNREIDLTPQNQSNSGYGMGSVPLIK